MAAPVAPFEEERRVPQPPLKLPESVRGYVDMALNSGMVDDVANQAGNLLGGLFGGDKK